MSREKIKGGFILLARKMLKTGVMEKHPLYIKLWVWILLNASWQNHNGLKPGELFTTLARIQKAMRFKTGFIIKEPSVKEIRGVLDFLKSSEMISIRRVQHGMIISVLNFEHYQNWQNYAVQEPKMAGLTAGSTAGHNENLEKPCQPSLSEDTPQRQGTRQGTMKGTIIKKEGIERREYNIHAEISLLKERYSSHLITKIFQAISSTRKTGKVADSVLHSFLQKCEKYPVQQVEEAMDKYLKRNFAAEGKGEKYLLGIIRNWKTKEPTQGSTGSTLLDSYYANGN